MTIAITRDVSSRFNECEITHIERTPIDVDIARKEHHEYIQILKQLGCQVIELPEEPDLPDSVFVEDTAFILDEARTRIMFIAVSFFEASGDRKSVV